MVFGFELAGFVSAHRLKWLTCRQMATCKQGSKQSGNTLNPEPRTRICRNPGLPDIGLSGLRRVGFGVSA